MIQIETGVPIPKQDWRTRYPLLELEVGQSFFVPDGDNNSISARASYMGKTHSRTFTVKKLKGGVRCWRVA
jgi:hypothetical protein